jgi:hypothetical protein
MQSQSWNDDHRHASPESTTEARFLIIPKSQGTDERSDGDAIGCAAVQILVVIDASQTGDRTNEITLLGTTIHEIRVGDLDGSIATMIRGDVHEISSTFRRKYLDRSEL